MEDTFRDKKITTSDIKLMLSEGKSVEEIFVILLEKGLNAEEIEEVVSKTVKEVKFELFQEKEQEKKNDERKNIAGFFMFIIPFFIGFFAADSTEIIMFGAIVSGLIGYFGFVNKPLAGASAGVCFAILFIFALNIYMGNRTRFIKIEFLIPMFIAGIPSLIVYFIVSKLVYSKK
jgi:hypothetical protein